ncbi:MAG: hypothetical protein HOO96_37700 [Polyangiaceae bacterium]|nr:hypothetical protein [Polyangiaceae bacterium]
MAHLVLDQDHTLTGVHHGSIRVLRGSFVMVGTLYGTLELQATATALVVGWQKGGVVVAGGALVVVTGNLDGDVFIASGGRVVVDPGGRLKGAVDNSGLLTVRGTVEGLRRGTGEVRVERGGVVRSPNPG